MQVQINTDSNIEGNQVIAEQVGYAIRDTLDRFSQHITRVEVHLSDENSDEKFGAHDKRCLIEARLANHQPISVSDQAATVEQSLSGAAEKMKHLLDTTLGRLSDR
ncbi:HPF/RaiA family ribosome-associated protein [Leptolyngbya sp. CCNP1308]|uniref:HPF/RaiA family ribosome-associated protein n=1 Tax=Leptolyngbya sp. CCNP1308 TaxID=3110255 RepID=UPI002B1ED6A6|nr:HPF/RaiA family ribosome-associated protein [Leptolyngbya sp. CCNP1308]MEA5452588.1 HPF/RaiA family ribosome-associated protein [Leptolyngbya sp. CCNP1308]